MYPYGEIGGINRKAFRLQNNIKNTTTPLLAWGFNVALAEKGNWGE